MKDSLSLLETIKQYDRKLAEQKSLAAEQERNHILQKFPRSAWPELALESYALGLGKSSESYCWLLEYGSTSIASIRGGSASKHLIYRHKDGTWKFPASYDTAETAWSSIRKAFNEVFDLAAAGRWDEVDDQQALYGAPALLIKTLFIYFPENILPICSQAHLQFFQQATSDEALPTSKSALSLNRHLLSSLRTNAAFNDWSNWEIANLLYEWRDPRDTRKIVKIAPGEKARYWNDCRNGGYMCLGWDHVGDLRQYESRSEFQEALAFHFPDMTKGKVTEKTKEIWTMLELEPGDIIVANNGISQVVGIGQVIEPGYQFRDDRQEMKHTIAVDWFDKEVKDILPQKRWAFKTVCNVPPNVYKMIQGTVDPVTPVDPFFVEIDAALKRKGQLIFYGPPGTGKTFHARRIATWLLLRDAGRSESEIESILENRDKLSKAETQLKADGFLDFVSFHPSYSYEDFVEGFRPVQSSESQGLSLRLEDGVFKEFCQIAEKSPKRIHVLLIDEFNRANVPKVLGELISVLEKDKRNVPITLSQSRKPFRVPPNVYIIATMNTADRSIRMLDTAIRRRFAFSEIMPDMELLEEAKVGLLPLDEFVSHLNEQLTQLFGREKQLGHALFLDNEEPLDNEAAFATCIREDVLPLLQEYCLDDYDSLAKLLGKELIDTKARSIKEQLLYDSVGLTNALSELIKKQVRGE